LATARGFDEIPHQDLPGPLFIIALGGAQCLAQHPTGSDNAAPQFVELFLQRLPEAHARLAVRAAEMCEATIWLVEAKDYLVKSGKVGKSESTALLSKFGQPNAREVTDFEACFTSGRAMEMCAITPKTDECAAYLRDMLASVNLQVLQQTPEPIVSVKASGVDKASALRWLCDHLGVPTEQVVAFGDGGNDVSMLELAGLGVAMANGSEAAKGGADVVSSWTNDQDGVAQELLKLQAESLL